MTQKKSDLSQDTNSRRDFLKSGSIAGAAAAVSVGAPGLSLARSANVVGRNTVKLGLIGCGGRGTGASMNFMSTKTAATYGTNVELHAMADVFDSRAQSSLSGLREAKGDSIKVNDDSLHIGLEAYKRVLDSDVDLVILATPPGFRPLHLEQAIDAGKHVFMEKPVAVDAPGIRRVIAAGEKAKEKNLCIQVGLQRRHEAIYKETVARLKEGMIGDLISSRVYWNGGGVWNRPRKPEDNELEYQMRNWYYFNWLCGDHIVEQHIHNIDVMNWVLDDFPVAAQGQGGRLTRTGKTNGEIYDHHMVEYTYANGHKMFSFCRHMRGCWNEVKEYVHGANGWAAISDGKIFDHKNELIWEFDGPKKHNGHQMEQDDFVAAIANGVYVNEAEYGAKSTFTAILGRLATYSGKQLSWDDVLANGPALANVDEITDLKTSKAPVQPLEDGSYKVMKPGKDAKTVLGAAGKKKKRKKK